MFAQIARFEFRYQLKNPVFWVTSAVFFLLTFGATTSEQIRIGSTSSVHKNAPFAINQISGVMSIFGIFVLVAFVANVVVRDDDTRFGPIIRSTRVGKFDYLIGRFCGAFAAGALALTSVQLGVLVGSQMPWVDPDTLGKFVAWHYMYGFVVVALPTLALTGAGFFALATATRSMMATYVGAVAMLVLYLTAAILMSKPQYEHMAALGDPFGVAALQVLAKYWTVAERNSQEPALTGLWLANRLIWLGVSAALLALAYALFRFDRVGAGRAEKAPRAGKERAAPTYGAPPPPVFSAATYWSQFLARTRIDMAGVFRSPAFFVLMALGLLNALGSLWTADSLYDVSIYPVTRAMIVQLRGAFLIMPIIIATYYAGELVWRDRDRRLHEIIDAAPVADWMYVAPKILALFSVLVCTLLMSVVTALAVQTIKGAPAYEFGHYALWYVLPEAINLGIFATLAIFVQAISPVKQTGWGIMGLYVVALMALPGMGYEDNLYLLGNAPDVPLSDMNAQGHFWIARAWFQLYWGCFAVALALLAHFLWRRGTEQRLLPRVQRLPARLAGPGGLALAVLLAGFAASFVWIRHNTHDVNEYRTDRSNEAWRAAYEHALIGYMDVPQPKITHVVLNVTMDPAALDTRTEGTYTLVNRTGAPLDHMHVRWERDLDMRTLTIDSAAEERRYPEFKYVIYKLSPPMAPGETRMLHFSSDRHETGFRNTAKPFDMISGRLAYNGTFLNDLQIAPVLGMSQDDLLQDRTRRRKYGLPAELHPPKLEDDAARDYNMLRNDSDWVTADITVSTTADQIPVAPGRKVEDRTEAGRRICRFVSDAPIQHFFSIQSARYQVATDKLNDIDLAVYYDAAHPMNVRRMLDAMKASLNILGQAFTPYQFHQARILEFPAYAQFAESFANTVPYSESIGFVENVSNPDDIDVVTYVTAHEIGHQWWAHQVIPARKQGETMLAESFAQYSAMLVLEHLQGPANLRKFRKYELDAYLRARGGQNVAETPLNRVEDKPYIHYQKGSVAMWFLHDELGEDTLNRAMRDLLRDYAFKGPPYADTRDFIRYLRQEAGPAHDQAITDTLEKITLYDINVKRVHATPRTDGKFDVTIDVDAHKYYADGYGKQTEAPLAESMDAGLFAREPGRPGFSQADVISFGRQPIHSGPQTLTLVADRKPAFGGVDPYNVRITRNSDTVLAGVE